MSEGLLNIYYWVVEGGAVHLRPLRLSVTHGSSVYGLMEAAAKDQKVAPSCLQIWKVRNLCMV